MSEAELPFSREQLKSADIQFITDTINKIVTPQEALVKLSQEGYIPTELGYNLSRSQGGVDVISSHDNRFLIFNTSPEQIELYNAFKRFKIPRFDVVGLNQNQSIACVELPQQAQPMDGHSYREQRPEIGYLGAFKKMAKLGELLAKIFKKTGTLPENLKLVDLAFISGDDNFIRLIPPAKLQNDVGMEEIEKIKKSILDDLMQQDIGVQHEHQVQMIIHSFHNTLKLND